MHTEGTLTVETRDSTESQIFFGFQENVIMTQHILTLFFFLENTAVCNMHVDGVMYLFGVV